MFFTISQQNVDGNVNNNTVGHNIFTGYDNRIIAQTNIQGTHSSLVAGYANPNNKFKIANSFSTNTMKFMFGGDVTTSNPTLQSTSIANAPVFNLDHSVRIGLSQSNGGRWQGTIPRLTLWNKPISDVGITNLTQQ